MKYLFIIYFLLLQLNSFSQFETNVDNTLNIKTIEYKHLNAKISIKKTITLKTDSSKIEIGLIVFRNAVRLFDFMSEETYLVFEDGSVIIFNENPEMSFESAGKNYYSVKHLLTVDEVEIFQKKKIDYFKIFGYSSSLDKWQKQDILKAIIDIIPMQ